MRLSVHSPALVTSDNGQKIEEKKLLWLFFYLYMLRL